MNEILMFGVGAVVGGIVALAAYWPWLVWKHKNDPKGFEAMFLRAHLRAEKSRLQRKEQSLADGWRGGKAARTGWLTSFLHWSC